MDWADRTREEIVRSARIPLVRRGGLPVGAPQTANFIGQAHRATPLASFRSSVSKPSVNQRLRRRGGDGPRRAFPLIAPEPREARRRAKLPGAGLLRAGDFERAFEMGLRFGVYLARARATRFRRKCDGFPPRTTVPPNSPLFSSHRRRFAERRRIVRVPLRLSPNAIDTPAPIALLQLTAMQQFQRLSCELGPRLCCSRPIRNFPTPLRPL